MKWLKGLWDKVKPGVKAALIKLIRTKLQPEIVKFITVNKAELLKRLETIRPEDNAKFVCDWLEKYFDKQL